MVRFLTKMLFFEFQGTYIRHGVTSRRINDMLRLGVTHSPQVQLCRTQFPAILFLTLSAAANGILTHITGHEPCAMAQIRRRSETIELQRTF